MDIKSPLVGCIFIVDKKKNTPAEVKMNDQLEKVSLRELLDRCITTPGHGDNVLTIDWSDEPLGKEFYEYPKLKTGITERTLSRHETR